MSFSVLATRSNFACGAHILIRCVAAASGHAQAGAITGLYQFTKCVTITPVLFDSLNELSDTLFQSKLNVYAVLHFAFQSKKFHVLNQQLDSILQIFRFKTKYQIDSSCSMMSAHHTEL